ncbi:acetate uptake transporter [Acidiphilium sp.]|uniref:acetate uptake transporter n=1 Tax=Acidiphilium sp. TaxID=527 RepID=UPI00258F4CF0|nr:acetate uptake transporter [Acidiphilium sp.]
MNTFNPAPLGLFGFALTTWLLSMINAGLLPGAGLGMVLAMAFAFGGSAQFVAGLGEMKVGNTFGFVAFCSYGAFWWTFALFVEIFAKGVPGVMVGWYLLVWGAFSFVMFIGTFALNKALQLIFGFLTATFILLALNDLLGAAALGEFGGYLGLVTAVLAFYLGAAGIINGAHGKEILPIGAKA